MAIRIGRRKVNLGIFFKRNPFLAYAIIGLFFATIVHVFDILYDSGGIRGVVFWVGEVFNGFFWVVSEVLFEIGNGEAVPLHDVITIVLGLSFAALMDWGWRRVSFYRSSRKESGP